MKVRSGLARLWMMTLMLALVLGPGLAPARAQDPVPYDGAGPEIANSGANGAVDLLSPPSDGDADPSVDLPPGTEAGWWATVQEDIRQSEYQITWQEHTYLADLVAAYQAPNRAHNLRTYFGPEGIRVIPRAFEGETPPWEWGLSLTGYGYTGAVQPVSAATLQSQENRIEYRRDLLSEWYVNDERGLEQGFTLEASPQPGGEGDLVLELALRGDLSPQLTADGSAVEFITPGGVRVLNYGELAVYDASGRSLAAHLEPGQDVIRIRFDATDALYPITVDPLAAWPSWTATGEKKDARFGRSVATAGDVNGDGYSDVIVGAPGYDGGQPDEGRAYVYYGSASGLGITPTTMDFSCPDARSGYSVGTAGDVNGDGYSDVIVGAPGYGCGEWGWLGQGLARVYLGSATGLMSSPAWGEAGEHGSDFFGYSVGTAGDVNGDGYSDIIVGAIYHSNDQDNEGRAYVYLGSGYRLGDDPAWTAEGNQDGAHFGASVGTAGDVNGDGYSDVIVGADSYDNGQTDEGRAYVYLGGANGLSVSPSWTAESGQAGAAFGASVGTAGDVNGDGYSDVIVGAPDYDSNYTDAGRAYVYLGSATGLKGYPTWRDHGMQAEGYFGFSVGTAGDVNGDGYSDVIVGERYYDNGQNNEGRAYVYLGIAAGLHADPDWAVEGNQAMANFGTSVGTAGDVNGDGYSDVIVGMPQYSVVWCEGRAYVFHGSASGLATFPVWAKQSEQAYADYGTSVGTAGDVNGDGYSDVIVGASRYDNGQADEGRAYVYLGGAAGLGGSPAWTAESNQEYAHFGQSVGTAGDVNGDGYSDVIVGAKHYDNGQAAEGRAYVYHGGAGGLGTSPGWTAEGNQDGAWFGTSVGTAGDVNGDGYGDVVIGASGYDHEQTDEGRAYVYHGGAGGLGTGPDWTAEGNQEGAWFGLSVGAAGDVNGDGYSDVIIGAPFCDGSLPDEGWAYLYHGGPTGLSGTHAWSAHSVQAGAHYGNAVATAGDVNGDGYSDVLVGAFNYTSWQPYEGRVYGYHGSAAGLSNAPAWMPVGFQERALFGSSVATAGDVNGDGYSDVVVGAPGYDGDYTNEGQAYVYLGGPNGLDYVFDWTALGREAYASFGYSVGTAGDVNGDGYSELIVGAPQKDRYVTDEGRAFVYFGNGGDGLHLRPRQLRTDVWAPISRLGMSDSATAFRVSLMGRMPLGRAKVKLQWQVAAMGGTFVHPLVEGRSPFWIDTGTGGVVLVQTIRGLTPSTPYKWRVRLLYRPGNALGQAASRWIHIPWAGWNETDLRTPVMKIYLPLVVRDD